MAIDVVPRTPYANLSRVLMVSRHIPESLGPRTYRHDPLWIDSLLDAYTEALLTQVEEIASRGLLREYERHDLATPYPRGRILPTATTRLWARGKRHEVATSRFEREADIAANRCLKYALWFLAGRLTSLVPKKSKQQRLLLDRLAPLYAMFEPVSLDHSLGFLRDGLVDGRQRLPTLRSYYRPALDLAAAIVNEHGVQLDGGGGAVQLPSLVLDMGRLFEHYLRNVLRAEAREHDWREAVLDGNTEGSTLLFDEQPSERATPDIVLHEPASDRYPLIIEVKSVPVAKLHSQRSDLEQAITYGVSYRCDNVVLAHPRADSNSFTGLRRQGRMGELNVYQYVFDLTATPLQDEEARFASAMEGLLASA